MFKLFKSNFLSRFYSLNSSAEKINDFLNKHNLIENHTFCNGKRINGLGEELVILNPATGKSLTTVKSSSKNQLDECLKYASEAQQIWKNVSQHDKSKVMRLAANIIRSKSKDLAIIDVLDTGKPLWEAEADINGCADTIDMFASFIYSNDGSHVILSDRNFYYTRKEPLGNCSGIGAWNYPFQMITWKSAPAIAAGNSFIFKPSPLTPLSAIKLAEIYEEAGVPKGLVSIIQGGSDIGTYLTSHHDISKNSFTGSVATGKRIMQSSVETLKRLTLELGGKSPLIIFDDADIDEAIKGVILANFLNQGEVCSNGTRVFIHSSIYPEFEKRLVNAVKSLKIGDPFDPAIAVGAMISETHFNTVMEYIGSVNKDGANVLCGGHRVVFPTDSYLSHGYYMAPCVVGQCSDDMRIVREEVFGPVVTLLIFESEDEVISRANDSIYGLAGGLFTKQLNRAHRVAEQLECGSVYVNTYNAFPPGMPFGGYKLSGIGRENCRETLDGYLQTKSVFVETNPIIYPFWPDNK